ncbi:MAG TPA: hemolysin family protein [Isosphaeraceae bacterium]|nr:hemolysin family protein [Isosphaeraceae bacterium]
MDFGASRVASRPWPRIARLLGGPIAAVRRRLGRRPGAGPPVAGEGAGAFEEAEHAMIKRVVRLGAHRASELMTPMNEIVWLDLTESPEAMERKITGSPHSRFPVCEGGIDNILGIVEIKDLLIQCFTGRSFGIKGLLKLPLFLFEGTPGLRVLETFQKTGVHTAIVLDEFGSVRGLITPTDILEAIVGDLPEGAEAVAPKAVRRPDGAWLLDGRLPVDEFRDLLGIARLPEGDYQTLAGLVIARLGRIPAVADRFEWDGARFEVVDMDGHRVDKVLVAPPPAPAS